MGFIRASAVGLSSDQGRLPRHYVTSSLLLRIRCYRFQLGIMLYMPFEVMGLHTSFLCFQRLDHVPNLSPCILATNSLLLVRMQHVTE